MSAQRNRNTRQRHTNRKRPPNPILQYVKLIIFYSVLIIVNVAVNFRVEYWWPLYIVLQGMIDSYKYTGMTFTLFYLVSAFSINFGLYSLLPVPSIFIIATCAVFLPEFYDEQQKIANMHKINKINHNFLNKILEKFDFCLAVQRTLLQHQQPYKTHTMIRTR